ncbi:MAG: response regulator transcription factor, partial [Xenococcaceae cyanobacterium MO_167.B52]|nr:response regulator transcription factor [Xenococcaceae cyanobacterium MO_167.B52]
MVNTSNGDRSNGTATTNQETKIRILVVDDQKMIREGLKALIKIEPNLEVVGTSENGEDAIKKVESLNPDVVLMDMEMPGMDGVTATKAICQKFPNVKVLVLSTFDTEDYVSHSLSSGAMGYLLKGTPAKELTTAIQSVYLGYAQIGPGIYQNLPLTPKADAQKLPETATFGTIQPQKPPTEELSPRLNGQLAAVKKSEPNSSALAIKDKSALAPRKFEQTVMLRQSPKWSRATIWAVAGVTVFVIGWSFIAKIEQVVPA